VLGLHNYGLGWQGYEYRSIAIPFLLSNPRLEAQPLSLADALDAQSADYLLLDGRMQYFLSHADARMSAEFAAWLDARGAVRVARIEDASYGVIEIYHVNPS
jgi:hypothetical protein